jgi:hypothetical protein
VLIVAVPPAIVAVPSDVAPVTKETVPFADEGEMVAVRRTGCPADAVVDDAESVVVVGPFATVTTCVVETLAPKADVP